MALQQQHAVDNTLLYSTTTPPFRKDVFVGVAKVHVERDSQKISCSTSSSENTNGLQFSVDTRMRSLPGY
jgi:hypothetical protein